MSGSCGVRACGAAVLPVRCAVVTCLSVLDHSAAAHRPRLPSSPHASPTPGSGPPCLLYIHGGGFIGSSFANDARLVVEWAKATGMMVRQPPAAASPGAVAVARLVTARTLTHVCLCAWFLCAREQVVFIHYSLAPEHRFPVALNECMRVYGWLRRRCSKVRRPPTQPVTRLHTRRNGGSCDLIALVYLILHIFTSCGRWWCSGRARVETWPWPAASRAIGMGYLHVRTAARCGSTALPWPCLRRLRYPPP